MQPVTLHEEEPFECIRCGTPFAARSTIERVSAALAGSHWMFATGDRAELLKMCDSCRLEALAEGGNVELDPTGGSVAGVCRRGPGSVRLI